MAKCPHCNYEGRVDSVEAHISGKCDEAHKGKVGQGFRDSLPQLPDENDDLPEPEELTETISPGWAVVGATVAVAIVVVLVASTAPTEPVEDGEDDTDDPTEGWA